MNRRNFLTTATLGVSAVALNRSWAVGPAKPIKKAIQLVSILPSCKKDLPATIKALAEMGYQGVEVANRFGGMFGQTASDFRKMLEANGLICTGATVSVADLEGDNLKKTADKFALAGGKFINQAELIVDKTEVRSRDAWMRAAEKYNGIAEQLASFNLQIGLHNHTEEFQKTETGQCGWEIFFSNTSPKVVHELDVCHCIEGGGDPAALINQFGWRTKIIHIKEYPRNQVESFPGAIPDPIGAGKFAVPFGKGKALWPGIF
jgi:sugar phosphate isomerase/epimerase